MTLSASLSVGYIVSRAEWGWWGGADLTLVDVWLGLTILSCSRAVTFSIRHWLDPWAPLALQKDPPDNENEAVLLVRGQGEILPLGRGAERGDVLPGGRGSGGTIQGRFIGKTQRRVREGPREGWRKEGEILPLGGGAERGDVYFPEGGGEGGEGAGEAGGGDETEGLLANE